MTLTALWFRMTDTIMTAVRFILRVGYAAVLHRPSSCQPEWRTISETV